MFTKPILCKGGSLYIKMCVCLYLHATIWKNESIAKTFKSLLASRSPVLASYKHIQ